MEEVLVEHIATSYWRLARILRAEAAAIAACRNRLARDGGYEVIVDSIGRLSSRPSPLATRAAALEGSLSSKRRLHPLMATANPHWR
jgi:hypothetical protein